MILTAPVALGEVAGVNPLSVMTGRG
jgi:hypothetical protein